MIALVTGASSGIGEATASRLSREPGTRAEAILDAGPGGKAERFVPRPYWLAGALRILAPGLVRRALAHGANMTPATRADTQGPTD